MNQNNSDDFRKFISGLSFNKPKKTAIEFANHYYTLKESKLNYKGFLKEDYTLTGEKNEDIAVYYINKERKKYK